jgi:hypothetical protein
VILHLRIRPQIGACLAPGRDGYQRSRLASLDEERSPAALKGHRSELIDPNITEYRGRIIKTTADGVLPSAPGEIGAMITFPASDNCAYIGGLVGSVNTGLSADHELLAKTAMAAASVSKPVIYSCWPLGYVATKRHRGPTFRGLGSNVTSRSFLAMRSSMSPRTGPANNDE